MLAAEASLRTLSAYASTLQGRLALARATGCRHELAGASNTDLETVAALCARATDGIDAVLDRLNPELAAHAATVAEVMCQRDIDQPCVRAAARPRLVAVDAHRPA
jgi:hypothetical protein